jgi:hypothetical protein
MNNTPKPTNHLANNPFLSEAPLAEFKSNYQETHEQRVLKEQFNNENSLAWQNLVAVRTEPVGSTSQGRSQEEEAAIKQAEMILKQFEDQSVQLQPEQTMMVQEQITSTSMEIGGKKELTFSFKEAAVSVPALPEKQIPDANLNPHTGRFEVPNTQVFEQPKTEKDSDNPSLVDFGLFAKFAGNQTEHVYKAGEKAVKTAFKASEDMANAFSSLFKEFIFFKVLTPEQKKKKEQEEAKKKAQANVAQANRQRIVEAISSQNTEYLRSLQERLKPINQRLGLNLSIKEAFINGQLRPDLETALQKKESEEKEAKEKQEKAQKMKTMAASKKGIPGQKIDTMDMATEKQSHWSKAIG